jgi:hypothetical protein
MPEKATGSHEEAARSAAAVVKSAPTEPALPGNAAKQDDGVTNPRDGRGPLRRRDDQAVKLPLRPPH